MKVAFEKRTATSRTARCKPRQKPKPKSATTKKDSPKQQVSKISSNQLTGRSSDKQHDGGGHISDIRDRIRVNIQMKALSQISRWLNTNLKISDERTAKMIGSKVISLLLKHPKYSKLCEAADIPKFILQFEDLLLRTSPQYDPGKTDDIAIIIVNIFFNTEQLYTYVQGLPCPVWEIQYRSKGAFLNSLRPDRTLLERTSDGELKLLDLKLAAYMTNVSHFVNGYGHLLTFKKSPFERDCTRVEKAHVMQTYHRIYNHLYQKAISDDAMNPAQAEESVSFIFKSIKDELKTTIDNVLSLHHSTAHLIITKYSAQEQQQIKENASRVMLLRWHDVVKSLELYHGNVDDYVNTCKIIQQLYNDAVYLRAKALRLLHHDSIADNDVIRSIKLPWIDYDPGASSTIESDIESYQRAVAIASVHLYYLDTANIRYMTKTVQTDGTELWKINQLVAKLMENKKEALRLRWESMYAPLLSSPTSTFDECKQITIEFNELSELERDVFSRMREIEFISSILSLQIQDVQNWFWSVFPYAKVKVSQLQNSNHVEYDSVNYQYAHTVMQMLYYFNYKIQHIGKPMYKDTMKLTYVYQVIIRNKKAYFRQRWISGKIITDIARRDEPVHHYVKRLKEIQQGYYEAMIKEKNLLTHYVFLNTQACLLTTHAVIDRFFQYYPCIDRDCDFNRGSIAAWMDIFYHLNTVLFMPIEHLQAILPLLHMYLEKRVRHHPKSPPQEFRDHVVHAVEKVKDLYTMLPYKSLLLPFRQTFLDIYNTSYDLRTFPDLFIIHDCFRLYNDLNKYIIKSTTVNHWWPRWTIAVVVNMLLYAKDPDGMSALRVDLQTLNSKKDFIDIDSTRSFQPWSDDSSSLKQVLSNLLNLIYEEQLGDDSDDVEIALNAKDAVNIEIQRMAYIEGDELKVIIHPKPLSISSIDDASPRESIVLSCQPFQCRICYNSNMPLSSLYFVKYHNYESNDKVARNSTKPLTNCKCSIICEECIKRCRASGEDIERKLQYVRCPVCNSANIMPYLMNDKCLLKLSSIISLINRKAGPRTCMFCEESDNLLMMHPHNDTCPAPFICIHCRNERKKEQETTCPRCSNTITQSLHENPLRDRLWNVNAFIHIKKSKSSVDLKNMKTSYTAMLSNENWDDTEPQYHIEYNGKVHLNTNGEANREAIAYVGKDHVTVHSDGDDSILKIQRGCINAAWKHLNIRYGQNGVVLSQFDDAKLKSLERIALKKQTDNTTWMGSNGDTVATVEMQSGNEAMLIVINKKEQQTITYRIVSASDLSTLYKHDGDIAFCHDEQYFWHLELVKPIPPQPIARNPRTYRGPVQPISTKFTPIEGGAKRKSRKKECKKSPVPKSKQQLLNSRGSSGKNARK
jgi:hypothetical protein